jgi:hypothetical protein
MQEERCNWRIKISVPTFEEFQRKRKKNEKNKKKQHT